MSMIFDFPMTMKGRSVSMTSSESRNTIDEDSVISNEGYKKDIFRSVDSYIRIYTNMRKSKRRWKKVIP